MIIASEVLETIQMIQKENLDIRTITMGISLRTVPTVTAGRPATAYTIK